MGNDEHSQNVYKSATEQGLDPLAYCDRMEEMFQQTWRALDLVVRRLHPDDAATTQSRRDRAGPARSTTRATSTKACTKGWYCVGCEAFKPEKELVDGRCPLHPQTEPQWIKEKNYFFRLSKYQKPLLDLFRTTRASSSRKRDATSSFGCSKAVSTTFRSAEQGSPGAFRCHGIPGSVVYVWFDALINYAAAVGLGTDPERFEQWWPADLHLIGKDITRFHTVIWPAMLMSASLPLPRQGLRARLHDPRRTSG